MLFAPFAVKGIPSIPRTPDSYPRGLLNSDTLVFWGLGLFLDIAPMTLRRHGKAWNAFSRWCQARGLRPLPAHAWTVATYLRWCEPRLEFTEIVADIKAIARRHLLAGYPDPERNPMVKRTLAMIERRIENRHQRAALFDEGDFMQYPPEIERVPEEPKPDTVGTRKIKSMRSTPKLVSKRPIKRS